MNAEINEILKGDNFLNLITKLDRVVKNSLTIAVGDKVDRNTREYIEAMNDSELNFAIDTLSDVAERAFGSIGRVSFRDHLRDLNDGRIKIGVVAQRTDRLFKLMVTHFSNDEIVKIMMGW